MPIWSPDSLHTDQGRNFESALVRDMWNASDQEDPQTGVWLEYALILVKSHLQLLFTISTLNLQDDYDDEEYQFDWWISVRTLFVKGGQCNI